MKRWDTANIALNAAYLGGTWGAMKAFLEWKSGGVDEIIFGFGMILGMAAGLALMAAAVSGIRNLVR